MSDCGIVNGIIASCADLRRIGGVNKRAWVFNINDVQSYTIASGFVTAITFKTYGGLYKFENQKGSHSGGYTMVNQAGANRFFQHDVIMKLLATTPTDKQVIEDLAVAEVGVILENRNGEFVMYGKNNGLSMTAASQNTGTEAASDTSDTLTFQGEETGLPVYVLDTDRATTLALLESYEI